MKTLWLVRHAQALSHEVDQQDKDRPLSDLGVQQAIRLGQYFQKEQVKIDLMLVSGAHRTQSTAKLLQQNAGHMIASSHVVDDLYLASLDFIWKMVTQTHDSVDSLMVLGHNPGLEMLAVRFLPSVAQLNTGDMVKITFDCDAWSDAAIDVVEDAVHL